MGHLFEQTEAFIARRDAWWGRPGQHALMVLELGQRVINALESGQKFITPLATDPEPSQSDDGPTFNWDATDAFGVGPDSPKGDDQTMAMLEGIRAEFQKPI